MSDVILIRPAYSAVKSERVESRPPAGLLYVAAPLVQKGINVTIIDQLVENDWEERLSEALEDRTICVGITSLTSFMIINGIEIAKIVRSIKPECPIVWGGVHPTMEINSTIASKYVDIIVVGEGEDTFVDLVDALRSGRDLSSVYGIVYKDAASHVVMTQSRESYDLNGLPDLPLQLVNMNLYAGSRALGSFFHFESTQAISIETSRGCTNRCTYCVMASNNYFQKAKWKGMSATKIISLIKPIIDIHGIRAFTFIDDNFFVDIQRVKDFIDQLESESLRIEWFADVRMDTILKKMDVHFLHRMERNGLRTLGIGLESGSDRVLKYLRKGMSRDIYIQANGMLAKTGIIAQYGLIQGLPTETIDDAKQTYSLIAKIVMENCNAAPALNKLLPTPGTPLLEECKKYGFSVPNNLEGWADYCDVSWINGPAVWMDNEAAAFMLEPSQILYRKMLLKARVLGERRVIFEMLLWILSKEMIIRLKYNICIIPITGWLLHMFLTVRKVNVRIKSFYCRIRMAIT